MKAVVERSCEQMMSAGLRVVLGSLQARPELNGCSGILLHWVEAKGRWAVQVGQEKLLLREGSLTISDDGKKVSMDERAQQMPEAKRRSLLPLAAQRLTEHSRGALANAEDVDSIEDVKKRLKADKRVFRVEGVFSPAECKSLVRAADAAATRRGWDKLRHGKYPTTDMPLSEVSEVEPMARAAIFRRLLRPLAPLYFPHGFLPEHLTLRDAFYVKYSATPGHQRELEMHTDGSVFSFNILLSDPTDFEGGGTLFEVTGAVARPPQGAALAHSGQLRHSGVAISSGERYLLVGFVGCVETPYAIQKADWAVHDAFQKFGDGAWDREPLETNAVPDEAGIHEGLDYDI
jgi:hypothetical protein